VAAVIAHNTKRAHALPQQFNLLIDSPDRDGPQLAFPILTAAFISIFATQEQYRTTVPGSGQLRSLSEINYLTDVNIPVAVSVFPDELYPAPRSWTEQAYPKLIHFNKLPKGGHFAAFEQPQLLSEEVRSGFRSLRKELAQAA
jgi:pimeloyl-ACP methyl ester carboxylesterase